MGMRGAAGGAKVNPQAARAWASASPRRPPKGRSHRRLTGYPPAWCRPKRAAIIRSHGRDPVSLGTMRGASTPITQGPAR